MKSINGLAYKSSEIPELGTYDAVAGEYYDERLHPTCADFRTAARIYLRRFFEEVRPVGRFADIGCGISLIADFETGNLVLVDQSHEMLGQNIQSLEKRCINVEEETFGFSEFDWIFAILGDPYNSLAGWKNIQAALRSGGECVFIVPSTDWTKAFRTKCDEEKPNFARFLTSKGDAIYLRSLIAEPQEQKQMIERASLSLVATEHVRVGELPHVMSPKISAFMSADQNLLDIYRAKKPS